MEEKIYYQDSSILVTQSRFVTNGKTYAMRNISSVQMGEIPASNGGWVVLLLLGACLLIFGELGFKIFGLLIVIGSIFAITQNKPYYTVRINSNSGEVDGLKSRDRAYVGGIIKEINNAIIGG